MKYFADIRPPKSPNLPLGPVDYSQRYQDQLLNILRLYFNTIDNFTQQVANTDITPTDGTTLKFPHVAASDTTDQYAGGDDTPTLVAWNQTESIYGFTLNLDGSATCNVSGIYKITYSLQLVNNATSSEHTAYVWLKTDGTLVPRSTTAFTIPKATSVDSYVGAYSEVVFDITAGEEIRLYWATDKAATAGGTKGVYIYAEPAQTSPYARPAIPSAIGSITFVSALTP